MIPQAGYPAVIPFLTCGWPTPDLFLASVQGATEAGCPYFEVGFPFSDPIADGPVIQRTSSEALSAGMSVDRCFELTKRATDLSGRPAVVMTYANLVFYSGLDNFCERLRESGAAGLIVPDLSFEESGPVREACESRGIDLVSFLAPTTAPPRRLEVSAQASGFLYLVAVRGVTGGEGADPAELRELIQSAKSVARCPVLVGFGVRGREQVERFLADGADGVIVGSALLERVRACEQSPESVRREVLKCLEPMCQACLESPNRSPL